MYIGSPTIINKTKIKKGSDLELFSHYLNTCDKCFKDTKKELIMIQYYNWDHKKKYLCIECGIPVFNEKIDEVANTIKNKQVFLENLKADKVKLESLL